MRKKPKPAKQPIRAPAPGGGGYQAPAPARKPPHRTARKPPPLPPGGGYQVPPAKTVARRRPVKRKLALGEAVACCAAEALAASLRLTGRPVSDQDVLALYELTAGGPDEGATIEATLEAAAEYGLAGVRVRGWAEPHLALAGAGCRASQSLILGVGLPGPHALCDDGTAWWSWGWPYDPADFPHAVIEEAWEVTW